MKTTFIVFLLLSISCATLSGGGKICLERDSSGAVVVIVDGEAKVGVVPVLADGGVE